MVQDNYIFRLSDKVTRKSVSYKNRFGIKIAADLYLPKEFDESKKHAAIIIGAERYTVLWVQPPIHKRLH